MLFLCCIFVISNYFCYDNPAALETAIEKNFNVTTEEYGFLYTAYAIPNTILPLFGGLLLDKIGTRNGLILFTTLLCIGQGVFMLGGYDMSFTLMIIGRAIFGVGCESMYVGQSAIVSNWFINFELPLAISMISCIPLMGSFINGAIIPTIYENTQSFGTSFLVGFIMTLFSLLVVLLLTSIDYKTEVHDNDLLREYSKKRKAKMDEFIERKVNFFKKETTLEKELTLTKQFK